MDENKQATARRLDVDIEWADGSYNFKLSWAGAGEVERKAGCGISELFERVIVGRSHVGVISETIRQGLLGGSGGTVDGQHFKPTGSQVNALLDRYVTGPDHLPVMENVTIAKAILYGFMVGYTGDPEKDGVGIL